MSAEQDELAAVVNGADWTSRSQRIADAILAAGYRKPRQVTTVEELDALPVGSIVRCEDQEGFGMNVAERNKEGWAYVGSYLTFQSFHLAADELPFTVLREPQP